MDFETKQAWKYIKTLNYYAKAWKMPLEDLICGFLDDLKEQELYEERQQFIDGLRVLKFKKWLVGHIEISQVPEEKIELDNVKMNTFFRIWYWIPFKWGKGNKEVDINKKSMKAAKGAESLQLLANVATIIASLIAVIEFARSFMH